MRTPPPPTPAGGGRGSPALRARRGGFRCRGGGVRGPAGAGPGRTGDARITYLDAPDDALTTLTDLKCSTPPRQGFANRRIRPPYGSLVWANDDQVAACLLPTETGKPLTQIGILSLGSGALTTVLEEAVGSKEGFEVYDVRATSKGAIWTEADVLEGTWRVYSALLSNGTLVNPVKLEEGDATYETPTIGAVGDKALWQVLPKLPNDQGLTSRLMKATIGTPSATTVLENARRMGTPLYAAEDSVVITPRVDSSSIYYQLSNVKVSSGEVDDTLTLPASMYPLEAGYGRNGFMFSFADIYNYGGAIANLGTYTPMKKPRTASTTTQNGSVRPHPDSSTRLVQGPAHREVELLGVRRRPQSRRVLRHRRRQRSRTHRGGRRSKMASLRVRNAHGSKMASSCSAVSVQSGSASRRSRYVGPSTAFWMSSHTFMALRCTMT